jgi:hypothetical protein
MSERLITNLPTVLTALYTSALSHTQLSPSDGFFDALGVLFDGDTPNFFSIIKSMDLCGSPRVSVG